jgi:hypothetical protein
MLVVTYSEARKTFASILDKAKEDGAVIIKRADGSMFRLSPEQGTASPFEGIVTGIHLEPGELKSALEDSRRFSENRFGASRKAGE